MNHGTQWIEQLLVALLKVHCEESGECVAAGYTVEQGMKVTFPSCGNQEWVFLAKGRNTNHVGRERAHSLGIINLLSVRDPRDALVVLHRQQSLTNTTNLEACFTKIFADMLTYMTNNINRALDINGALIRFEELHSHPLEELASAAAVFGLRPSTKTLERVIRENSYKVIGGIDAAGSESLQVELSLNRKLKGRQEDVLCGVGEFRSYPGFIQLLPRANKLMGELLPKELAAYYLEQPENEPSKDARGPETRK